MLVAAPLAGTIGLDTSLARLALAVAVVALVAWAAGRAVARLGQPPVIGELAAVMSLGPSVAGALAPDVPRLLFPGEIRGALHTLAVAGVVLFMFFVGLDFDGGLLKARTRLVLAVVVGGVTLPFVLGTAIALPFADYLAGDPTRPLLCALFVGVALSVTAFPILAAIVQEADLRVPALGQLALACAAMTDLVAWSFLAILSAQANATGMSDVVVLLAGVAALTVLVLVPGRRLLSRGLAALPTRALTLVVPVVAIALAAALAESTERLGVTVIFGAFLAGVAMTGVPAPRRDALAVVRRVNRRVLLPIFFALVGLQTDLHTAGGPLVVVGLGLLLLAAAVVGKVGGGALAARLAGLEWRRALGLGVLVNTKGLTEIVVLSVGYELGLISAGALGILVAVALITTAATTPLLQALKLAYRKPRPEWERPFGREWGGPSELGRYGLGRAEERVAVELADQRRRVPDRRQRRHVPRPGT